MKEKLYVTTPIYYVNDVPHIGHAYTTVAADILARFNRLMGREVFFLTGTDEHGQKVEKASYLVGRTPKEHADVLCENFKNLWVGLNVTNDAFIRTTDPQHIRVVQDMLQKLYDKGEIEKRQYSGFYCTYDERFWTDKEVPDGNCPDCGRAIDRIEEENYFFLMSGYHDRLVRYIEDTPDFIQPQSRRNEVLGFLKSAPLGDLCISRPKKRLSCGVPMPFDDDFVTYVWFDALMNYYSATLYLAPQTSGQWWPATWHLIGKDILTTHSVFWSTMLMALDMPLPGHIFAHGWWTQQGKKMSKSLGNVVDPFDIIARYGADAFRYFLVREVTFGLDGDFSEAALIGRINSDLANDLGNLVNRTFSMLQRYFKGVIPQPKIPDEGLENLMVGTLVIIEDSLKELAYQKALNAIWELTAFLNKHIDTEKPWVLAKGGNTDRLGTVIYHCLEGLRFIGMYLYPFMPQTCGKLYGALTQKDIRDVNLSATEHAGWGRLGHGRTVLELPQLFPRIEKPAEVAQATEAVLAAAEIKSAENVVAVGELIGIEDFAKVKLKVGRVVSAEKVKGSSKLLRLQVDTGEMRQVVAGIGKHYSPETIVGRSVAVVCNLKPAKLMGIESQGMLLAASDDTAMALLTPDKEIAPGATIK
ncbi:methionine--tRNA ligase [Candidatus Magnetobacterium casense]|uniref:Methionine--tRNA ligase n=1 Tax=Candidatus Magnetobacterium casense TaxID=1455061 RepID=A0ABS6RZF8_9BACT|nr:methionine--tRNA ligase [Candidatus Magnetobacterium casensis]MBV6342034.1 methionine--tRNA ligase [Candidatus Magnetobacterium casensis]